MLEADNLRPARVDGRDHAQLGDLARGLAARLIDRLKIDFVNTDGLLSRDCPPTARTIFDNFDDVAPFMAWWGAEEFLLSQVGRLRSEDFVRLLAFGNLLHSYKIDEYIGGLNVVARATGDAHARALLTDAVAQAWACFADPDVGFSEFYDLDAHRRSPFFSPWAAGLLESCLELDEHDHDMQRRIESILDLWWSHPYVEETGLLPFRGSFSPAQEAGERMWAGFGRWAGEPPIRWDERRGSPLGDFLRRNRAVYRLRPLVAAHEEQHDRDLPGHRPFCPHARGEMAGQDSTLVRGGRHLLREPAGSPCGGRPRPPARAAEPRVGVHRHRRRLRRLVVRRP